MTQGLPAVILFENLILAISTAVTHDIHTNEKRDDFLNDTNYV